MPNARLLAIFLLGAGLLSSRAEADTPAPAARPGVVFVVGGIGGLDFIGCSARWALPYAGVRHEVREFFWSHGRGKYLKDLQDTRHFLTEAGILAEQVRQLKAEDPSRPVYLIGHSAGAGLVLVAAEQLPRATIERIVLLSAAVAPTYNLCAALRATRREIVSFNSEIDLFWLWWGTSQFGTVDRVYTPAAGLRGFQKPEGLSQGESILYDRLAQVTWRPEMVFESYGGLHGSTGMPGFLARQVAPWLKP